MQLVLLFCFGSVRRTERGGKRENLFGGEKEREKDRQRETDLEKSLNSLQKKIVINLSA